jgi:hypothetical protein
MKTNFKGLINSLTTKMFAKAKLKDQLSTGIPP